MRLEKIILILITGLLLVSCKEEPSKILIQNAKIYDGSGGDAIQSDILLVGDEIAEIGVGIACSDCQIIDATGLSVAPGFIDLHAHIEPLPIIPDANSALSMGVTTALGGPDGGSPISLGAYLDTLETLKTGINVAYLIGHNSVRLEVMGMEARDPSPEELEKMKNLISKGMDDGAFGISTGLKYLPGAWSKLNEVVELSKVASAKGGIYTSHLREEGLGLLEGVQEAIEISDRAKIPVVLTHHKAIGLPMWGASVQTLSMVDSARNAGLDIMMDQYPYTASYTSLSVLIPPWSMEGGRYDAFKLRCDDPTLRDSIKTGIIYNILHDRGGGDLNRIQIAKFDYKPDLEGKTLYDWAIERQMEPNAENGAELIIEAQLNRGGSAIYHAISEEDVERIMKHPMTMIASDGRLTAFNQGFPHPRAYGTFPRVIGHYARDKGYLTITEAIRKMTSMPALRLGLTDRGLILKGYKADLVIFDEENIIDMATFEKPHQYSAGIEFVIVNGYIALNKGVFDEQRHGKILRGPSYKHK